MDAVLIGAVLTQDALTTGAIYALLGMALVLVFSVTRVILFAQGEFVTYAALTLAVLQAGGVPGTLWLLPALAVAAAVQDAVLAVRRGEGAGVPRMLAATLGPALAISGLTWWAGTRGAPLWAQCVLSVALVTAMGPLVYRLVYQPLADAGVLVLLIASVAVHFVLAGLGLIFFGVEGFRTPAFWRGTLDIGPLSVEGQSVVIVAAAVLLIVLLWLAFSRTLVGKALRAAASNPVGARLLAISVPFSGALSFGVAAFIGALCGLLIAPVVTMYYDSGLLIGLKGFVSAIVGGMASFPLTLAGAMLVGGIESLASFWASAYKEVIVFLMVLPVLLWLSLRGGAHDEEGH